MCVVTGDKALIAKLNSASIALVATQPAALLKAGSILEAKAKQLVVTKGIVDTGNLLNTITTGTPSVNSIEVTSEASYSVYNEFGTSRMPARPYMRPALDESKPEIKRLIGAMVYAVVGAVLHG